MDAPDELDDRAYDPRVHAIATARRDDIADRTRPLLEAGRHCVGIATSDDVSSLCVERIPNSAGDLVTRYGVVQTRSRTGAPAQPLPMPAADRVGGEVLGIARHHRALVNDLRAVSGANIVTTLRDARDWPLRRAASAEFPTVPPIPFVVPCVTHLGCWDATLTGTLHVDYRG